MRWKLTAAIATIAATISVAACGSAASPMQAVTLKVTKVKSVSSLISTHSPLVGVNLYALHNYSAAETTAFGTTTLDYIKNDLHASGVDIVWNTWTAGGDHGNKVVTTSNTLTAANVGILTKLAKKMGLYVEYRPMMFVETKGNNWEGLVKPSNPAEWFNSYYQVLLPYLKMAQSDGINEFVIGTEMNDLMPDQKQWTAFLAKSGKVYKGQITYAANQHMYFPPDTKIPNTTLTGVDMYEPLQLPASASLSSVVAAYEKWFAKVPAALLKRTMIEETGIEARAGAYLDPPNLETQGTENQNVQYNWFMAGCESVKKFHLRGIFFWKVDLSDNPVEHPASSLSTFEGKKGAAAIASCEKVIKG